MIIAASIFVVVRTNLHHKKSEKKIAKKEAAVIIEAREVLERSLADDLKVLSNSLSSTFKDVYTGLTDENRSKLKKALKEANEIEDHSNTIIGRMMQGTQFLEESELQEDLGFGKAVSSIQDVATSFRDIAQMAFEHVDNNHSGLSKYQKEDFKQLRDLQRLLKKILQNLKTSKKK